MKKSIAVICALLLVFCSSASASEASLLEISLEHAALIGEMAASPEYLALYTNSISDEETREEIAALDMRAPRKAFLLEVSFESLWALLIEEDLPMEFPEGLETIIRQRFMTALPNILNASGGTEKLVLASVLTISSAYPNEAALDAPLYLLLEYEGEISVFNAYFPIEGDILLANSGLVFGDVESLPSLLGEAEEAAWFHWEELPLS